MLWQSGSRLPTRGHAQPVLPGRATIAAVWHANAVSRPRGAMRPNDAETFAPKIVRAQGDPKKGAGKCRVPVAPAVRVQRVESTRSSPQVHRDTRHSLRNGFNGLFRALPGDEFVLSPSPADEWRIEARLGSLCLRRLDTSNGCQDHTALPSASAPFVCTPFDRSRTKHPPCDLLARRRSPRPPHPIPTFVTMANAPLSERDGEGGRDDLGQMGSGLFLKAGLDRANHVEATTENRISAHVNRERAGRVFVRFAAHSRLKADIA